MQAPGVNPVALRSYIKDNGLKHKENSVSYIFTCPRCEKKEKLYIRKSDGRFVCWYCKEIDGYRGRCEYALADLMGVPVSEVQAALFGAGWAPNSLELEVELRDWYGEGDEAPDESETILERVEWPWNFYPLDHKHSERGRQYLLGRGVPIEIAQSYGIRYCPEKRQVIFPVQQHGRLYGWQGRVLYPAKCVDEDGNKIEVVKSPTSKGLKADHVLMFADRLADVDHAIVAEGPFDGLKAHLCGGNVVTMGKGISRHQIQLLKNSGKRKIYCGLDPDAADDTARLVKELDTGQEVYVFPDLPPPPLGSEDQKMDLGRLSMEEVYDLFRRAIRVGASHLFVYLKPPR